LGWIAWAAANELSVGCGDGILVAVLDRGLEPLVQRLGG
jgi:hypothetical protein